MSQAEDLLNSLSEDVAAYTAESDTEPHIVIGKDRVWNVPDELKRIAVQNDKNIETVTFDCYRYWDEHDLSQLVLEVVFMRKDKKVGCKPCENIYIDENDDTLMHFTWTVGGEATEVDGELWTLLRASSTEKEYNSEICKEFTISAGLKCHEDIILNYPDVITHILEQLKYVSNATDNGVQYVAQSLKEEQQAQARANIGAASASEVSKLSEDIDARVVAFFESTFIPTTQENYDAMVEAGTVDENKYYMITG